MATLSGAHLFFNWRGDAGEWGTSRPDRGDGYCRLPLLGITLATYLLAAWKLLGWLAHLRQNWYWLFLFLAFVEYYFFLPGPIVAPRYQIPALPFLAIMAAMQLPAAGRLLKRFRSGTNEETPQEPPPQNPHGRAPGTRCGGDIQRKYITTNGMCRLP